MLTTHILLKTSAEQPYITPEEDALIQEYNTRAKDWGIKVPPRQVALEYADYGSRVSKVRPFGKDVVETVKPIRQVAGLVNKSTAWTPGSEEHYHKFQQGPLTGYITRALELGPQDANTQSLVDGKPLKNFGEHALTDYQSFAADGLPANTQKWNSAETANRVSAAIGDYTTANKIVPSTLSHQDQIKLLQDVDANLKATNPDLWKEKQLLDWQVGIANASAGQSYSGIAKGISNLELARSKTEKWRALAKAKYDAYQAEKLKQQELASKPKPVDNTWRNVALGAGGTLAAGAGIYALYKLLNKKKSKVQAKA